MMVDAKEMVIDAVHFIKEMDRNTLEKQIEETRAEFDRVKGQLSALISLRRLIDYRDGKVLRKYNKKKNEERNDDKPSVEAEADDSVGEEEANEDDDSMSVELLANYMRKRLQPINAQQAAAYLKVSLKKALELLEGHPDKFSKTGMGLWDVD